MKNKIFVVIGCIALALCFSLNVRNSLNDYDIPNISLISAVWAQTSGAGSGINSGSGAEPCYSEMTSYEPIVGSCFKPNSSGVGGFYSSVTIGATYTLTCMQPTNFIPTSFCWHGQEKVSYRIVNCTQIEVFEKIETAPLVQCGYL